jgi:hypothetical protein
MLVIALKITVTGKKERDIILPCTVQKYMPLEGTCCQQNAI